MKDINDLAANVGRTILTIMYVDHTAYQRLGSGITDNPIAGLPFLSRSIFATEVRSILTLLNDVDCFC